MLLSDGAGPGQEAVISLLTENAQAFTCLSSFIPPQQGMKGGHSSREQQVGAPPAPQVCSMANPVQQEAFT